MLRSLFHGLRMNLRALFRSRLKSCNLLADFQASRSRNSRSHSPKSSLRGPKRLVSAIYSYVQTFVGEERSALAAAFGFAVWLWAGFGLVDGVTVAAAEVKLSGEQLYRKQCASCHGVHGEGVKDEYEEALTGDWSLSKLTSVIVKTMPDEKPKLCVGEEAELVAKYVFDAFYSQEAQLRNRPPSIAFSRLTNRQFKQSVADLLNGFKGAPRLSTEERGLKGEYYATRNYDSKKKVFTRVDGSIDFDFGEAAPKGGKFPDPATFSAKWWGSVLPEETGTYEFIVKAENGVRLWVNDDMDKKLIDGWVASRQPVTHRASIHLLGGRPYPIRFEFFKFKGKRAAVSLLWKPPGGVEQVIPARNLAPASTSPSLCLAQAFPADDASAGYERGTLVSPEWDEAVTYAAVEAANAILVRIDKLAKTKPNDPERPRKLREFAVAFVEVALRRPLTEAQRKFYVDDRFDAEGATPEAALKEVVLLTLKSPRFLYPELPAPKDSPAAALSPEEPGSHEQYARASRLALALWDSLPDQSLRHGASAGHLRTDNQLRSRAKTMLRDVRAKAKLRGFFRQWLHLNEAAPPAKDSAAFPKFDAALADDLRHSLFRFLDHVVWEGSGDYRELLRADYLFLNPRLADYYGAKPPDANATGFQRVSLPGQGRAGVVTHPYLLSTFAYADQTSPIHRGVFLARHVVGRALKPPPNAVEFKDADFDPHLTMREKVTELTKAADCMSCHAVINPLGFALERYDAVGRLRQQDKGKPVNTASDYLAADGRPLTFKRAGDVAAYAADNEWSRKKFIEQLFNHVAKQPARAYGRDTIDELWKGFSKDNFNVPNLLAEIAVVVAKGPPPPEPVK